ncbi:MAG TPA: outer membrane beta-barrel protein [Steroidobacter sp.]|jgi:hypothetical protein|nr:outer membrane beta-barrel protein [Steroidobacter sp.]
MQRCTLSVLAALVAALPLATQADTQGDYSFIELNHVDTELDGFDDDGEGFELRGSVAFHESFFAFAEYQDLDYDFGDVTTFKVGVGGHWPINDTFDVVGRFGIVQHEVDVDRLRFDDDEDGFILGGRVRGKVMPRLELEGGFDYVDLDSGDDASIVLEGRYFFVDNVSGGLRLELGDADLIGIGARLTF